MGYHQVRVARSCGMLIRGQAGSHRLLLPFSRLNILFAQLVLGVALLPIILVCEAHSLGVGIFVWTSCGVAATGVTSATLVVRASFPVGTSTPSLKTPPLNLGGGFVLLFLVILFDVVESRLKRNNLSLE